MQAARPAQRLLANGVVAATLQLVRAVDGKAAERPAVRRLMRERRRLLAELARDVNTFPAVGSLAALQAAVAESDRTLEALLGGKPCTKASIPSS